MAEYDTRTDGALSRPSPRPSRRTCPPSSTRHWLKLLWRSVLSDTEHAVRDLPTCGTPVSSPLTTVTATTHHHCLRALEHSGGAASDARERVLLEGLARGLSNLALWRWITPGCGGLIFTADPPWSLRSMSTAFAGASELVHRAACLSGFLDSGARPHHWLRPRGYSRPH